MIQELGTLICTQRNGGINDICGASPSKTSKFLDPVSAAFSPKLDFDDGFIDDDLDPAMKEELDR